jgi:hypothetical protein
VLTGKTPAISTETHHKAQQDVIKEDQPTIDHFTKMVFGINLVSTIALWLNSNVSTVMHHITTFRSMTDHVYDGGPITLYHKIILHYTLYYNTIVLKMPTVFCTVKCCTGL